MINRNTLPQDVQEILKQILSEEPSELNENALKFLKARQDYLTNAEKELYFGKEVKTEEVKPIIKRNKKK